MAKAFSGQDWEILANHVAGFPLPPPGASGYVSTFNAAVQEARRLTGRDKHGRRVRTTRTLWAGTLVYFALLDQIGNSLRPNRAKKVKVERPSGKLVPELTLEKAIRQFAPSAATRNQRQTLYFLRCAFAHEYGLFNRRDQFFRVDDSPRGRLVVPARRKWNGRLADATAATQTTVNLVAVGNLAEAVVASVRTHSARSTLRSELPTKELQRRFGFTIVP